MPLPELVEYWYWFNYFVFLDQKIARFVRTIRIILFYNYFDFDFILFLSQLLELDLQLLWLWLVVRIEIEWEKEKENALNLRNKLSIEVIFKKEYPRGLKKTKKKKRRECKTMYIY